MCARDLQGDDELDKIPGQCRLYQHHEPYLRGSKMMWQCVPGMAVWLEFRDRLSTEGEGVHGAIVGDMGSAIGASLSSLS